MHWEFGFFSWFLPLSHQRQLGEYSSYKDSCIEPAWWSRPAIFPECFPSCQQTYVSIFWCFLFKLFRQSSSLNFHFEVQLAFPVVETQSSTTHWGKASLLVTSLLSPAFIWYSLVFLMKEAVSNCPFLTFSIPSFPSRLFCCSLPSLSLCLQSSYWNLVYLGPE